MLRSQAEIAGANARRRPPHALFDHRVIRFDDELLAAAQVEQDQFRILAAGEQTATVWTNDLTPGYVHENSAYSS